VKRYAIFAIEVLKWLTRFPMKLELGLFITFALIFWLLATVGCSPVADRFDARPQMCRDLGKVC